MNILSHSHRSISYIYDVTEIKSQLTFQLMHIKMIKYSKREYPQNHVKNLNQCYKKKLFIYLQNSK